MTSKQSNFDISNPYVRRARLQPALIVVLPLALATLAWFPSGVAGWGVIWGVVVACGGTALLVQVARDAGKRKEKDLYALWGGMPTICFLRHRDAKNPVTLARYHAKLAKLIKGVTIPSQEAEQQAPDAADAVYDTCTKYLLEATRDQKKFSLLFDENCSYGFRRNLWGMKSYGIVFASIGLILTLTLIAIRLAKHTPIIPAAIICGTINFGLLLIWIFWIRPEWVRIPAEAYGERLLAASEVLK
jgi:hypothetical protein